jgi:dihydroorotase
MADLYDLVVAGATIVTAAGEQRADFAVKAGKVAAIGIGLEAARRVDGTGLHVLPGLIDIHVHFREPGLTYKEDFGVGTQAAAVGGVTTVHEMPNTAPATATGWLFHEKVEAVSPHAHVDFGLYGVILQDNESELALMAAAGAMGFKLFMGQTTGNNPCPDDGVIYGAFREIAQLGLVVGVHAENNPILQRLKRELRETGRTDPRAHLESRPAFVEAEAVGRAIAIAEGAGNRLHIHHLSTRPGLERLVWAKQRGLPVTCEALVAHLLLDDTAYARYGNLIQLNPPIRERQHVDALWAGVRAGDVDCIATDHAPHSIDEQSRENVWDAYGGFIGVETMLPLLLTQVAEGQLSLPQLVRLTSENPARLYGYYPNKGALAIGSDADFVLVDLQHQWRLDQARLHAKHPVTPYHGWQVTGRPVATYLRGECVARDGEVVGPPRGRLVRPGPGGAVA